MGKMMTIGLLLQDHLKELGEHSFPPPGILSRSSLQFNSRLETLASQHDTLINARAVFELCMICLWFKQLAAKMRDSRGASWKHYWDWLEHLISGKKPPKSVWLQVQAATKASPFADRKLGQNILKNRVQIWNTCLQCVNSLSTFCFCWS
jgi:hypothetical protein